MLLYLHCIIMAHVLPQFISPNGHGHPDYDCFNDPELLQDGPSVSLTSRSHLLVPRCGVNNGQW